MTEGDYKLVLRWPATVRPPRTRYQILYGGSYNYQNISDTTVEDFVMAHTAEIEADLEDIDEDKIFAALPRSRREDALPKSYEPLQKEVAMQVGHFPFDGKNLVLKKYKTVGHYKKPNGRIGFRDLAFVVWGVPLEYEAEVEVRVLDTKGMSWIVGWRRSDGARK
jgi:hypothetical protein